MPGILKPPGAADVTLRNGSQRQVSEAAAGLARKTGQWPPISTGAFVQRRYSSDPRPLSLSARFSAMTEFEESTSDDESGSESSVHEGFENLRLPRPHAVRNITPGIPSIPSTPPTHSDAPSQKSPAILPMPKTRGQPTSDVSPPTSMDSLPSMPAVQMSQKPQPIQSSATLRAEALNRPRDGPHDSATHLYRSGDKLQTSGGKPSFENGHIQLPAEDELPSHWLDDPSALADADARLGHVHIAETPTITLTKQSVGTSPASKSGSGERSAFQSAAASTLDLERHVTYVNGSDDSEYNHETSSLSKGTEPVKPVTGLGLLTNFGSDVPRMSAEDVNNLVYKQLQEQNVQCHNDFGGTYGAISASVVVSAVDSTPKQLKRTAKCHSLRSGNNDASSSSVVNHSPEVLAVSKKRLQPSLVNDSHVRQASSPAWLGSRRLDSDRPRKEQALVDTSPTLPRAFEHTLRHMQPTDRLSNNLSVRRTSLDSSPKATKREPIQSAATFSSTGPQLGEKEENIAIKRQGPAEITADGNVSMSNSPPKPPHIRGVIPSLASESNESQVQSPRSPHSLRHFSREERLENVVSPQQEEFRRPSTSKFASERPRPADIQIGRRRSTDASMRSPKINDQDQAKSRSRSISSDANGPWPSSPHKAIDARAIYPNLTPFSAGQYSDTDLSVHFHEANGVQIFSHNNHSIRELDLQSSSRPASKDKNRDVAPPEPLAEAPRPVTPTDLRPIFTAQVEPPSPLIGSSMPNSHVDSPLTKPRAAPAPPVIKFIPPTPDQDVQSEDSPKKYTNTTAQNTLPTRRGSLLQKARRYSESVLARTGSLRRTRQISYQAQRPSHLSPMWRPEGFWDEVGSDEEDYDSDPERDRLPAGGDTSDEPAQASSANSKVPKFPRQMSKRLPGFRGTGGFLLGNSIGIDRHGTNNRRHYISTGTHKLSPNASQEFLERRGNRAVQSSPDTTGRSSSFVQRSSSVRKRPSSGLRSRGFWLSARFLRARVRAIRTEREERAREKRREELRDRIGMRVYHQGQT